MRGMMLGMLAVPLVMVAAACAGNGAASASAGQTWDLTGRATAVEPGTPVRVTVAVASGVEGYDTVVVHVGPEATVSVQEADGSVRPAAAGDIRVGDDVRVNHTGVQMRSLPPQYVATEVRVVRGE